MYRCGKCGTNLPVARKVLNAKDGLGAIPVPVERGPKENSRTSKHLASHFSVTTIVSWFKIKENLLIFSFVVLALLLHFLWIAYAHELRLDEHYYVPEARSIIHERAILYPEHPSVAKLFIASGMLILGDNPWGWRIPSVVFGIIAIISFYLICRRLANKRVALLASFFLVFESLTFVMSGIAMLDVFCLAFMLLAFLFYLNDRYVFSGIFLALSALCKLTGLLGIFVILGHWLIRRRQSKRNIALFLMVLLVAFIVLLPASDFLATGHWLSPIDRVSQMLHLSSSKTFASQKIVPSGLQPLPTSYPWTWILSLKPYFNSGLVINLLLWILIIPSMAYTLYEFIRRKTDISLFVLLWFAATYLMWIPAVLLTDRTTYVYYFYPALGAVCIGLCLVATEVWDFASRRHSDLINAAVRGYLALYVLAFIFLGLIPVMAALLPHSLK
jgi:predicted membrane-bound dolichyl-phosphate-mannose-protein mannosyltransferase